MSAAVKIEKDPGEGVEELRGFVALNAAQVLVWGRGAKDWETKRRAAGWQGRFCFAFHGGTLGTLWPMVHVPL